MQVVNNIAALKLLVRQARSNGQSIGFVPTMGYLHEGHLQLVRQAALENELVVMSIFVNPLQFGPSEDFEKYPRNEAADIEMAANAGCHIVFIPTAKEMYPKGFDSYVDVQGITTTLCGAARPGHFRGVATVVMKLFNLVAPTRAYFGQKDAQQALLIQKMANDLNMDLEIVVVPTVRETDGLAMSSRNAYLSADERKSAAILYQSLTTAKAKIMQGLNDPKQIVVLIKSMIQSEPLAVVEYVEVVSADDLKEFEQEIQSRVLIALAVRFGKTRLIDNMIIDLEA